MVNAGEHPDDQLCETRRVPQRRHTIDLKTVVVICIDHSRFKALRNLHEGRTTMKNLKILDSE